MATPTDGLPIPWFIMFFHGLSSCSPETQWPVSSMFELCHHAFLGISQRYSGGNKALNLLPLLATHRLKWSGLIPCPRGRWGQEPQSAPELEWKNWYRKYITGNTKHNKLYIIYIYIYIYSLLRKITPVRNTRILGEGELRPSWPLGRARSLAACIKSDAEAKFQARVDMLIWYDMVLEYQWFVTEVVDKQNSGVQVLYTLRPCSDS